MQVLCLVGEGKMGKSHLLTKIFPVLARDYDARYAILDLRNESDTILDLLHLVCSQLTPHDFTHYYTAHNLWADRLSINVEHITTILTRLNIHSRDSVEATQSRNRHLTTQFVQDLSELADAPLLLLFDSVECATEGKQFWLMHSILPQLSPFGHIKVVVAGRSLPAIHGSYAANCRKCRLASIEDDSAYVAYCQQLHLRGRLGEQTIRDFAFACDYTPGLFAELVFKFMPQR